METGPIFIGGLANSGKTELRLMLEVHPNLSLTRRTYMWTRFYQRFGDLAIHENFERCLTQMLQNKHIQALEPDVARIRSDFLQGKPTYAQLFGLIHSQYAARIGKPRWGDQLGSVERYATPIFEGYPTARMIQMVRNPRHIYEEAKARSHQRPGKVGWTMAAWLHSVRCASDNLCRFPNHYKIVTYERLMSQPEETLREVCEFIGEEYLPEMVNESRVNLQSFSQVPAAEMSMRERAFVQQQAKSELLGLGYTLETNEFSIRDRLLYLGLDWPINRAAMLAWQSRNREITPAPGA